MAFFDKLNDFASAATEKASGAIETGKLSIKVNAEEKKINEATAKIGECLLTSLDAGQEYDEAIMALYAEIQASREAIAAIKAELATLSGVMSCSRCSAKNPLDSKFCRECGNKFEEPPVTQAEVVQSVCPGCGNAITPTEKFCTSCGKKLDD